LKASRIITRKGRQIAIALDNNGRKKAQKAHKNDELNLLDPL